MNPRLKQVSAVLLLFLLLPWQGMAQNDLEETLNESIKKVTLPSSNAASLLKFTELPVNYSTGTPDISIPIYTINTGKLTLPVTLRYVASGIRVLDNASSVGLGFSLSAEGTIQQSIFGLEDNGTYHQNGLNWTNAALLNTNPNDYNLLEQLNSNGLDGVPDVYTFSFPGNSGKFIYADQIRCLPQQNLAISTNADGWKIVSQDGTQYFFTLVETTTNRDAPLSVSSSKAWYLTKIRDANNVDSIVLEYESLTETQTIGRSYSFTTFRPDGAPFSPYSIDMAPNDPPLPGHLNTIIQNTNGWQLKRIMWNSGSLEYDIAWNDREDMIGPKVPRVKNILLVDRTATVKRVIHFDQDYFLSDDVALTGSMGKRLRLQRVTFAPSLATINSADAYTYSFEYNPLPLPSKQSNQIDHWGFYNGATGNDSRGLIPSFTQPGIHYYGADRNVNPSKLAASMLTRINYPTGGYAQFDWQVHSKSYPTQLLDSIIVFKDSTMYIDMAYVNHEVSAEFEDVISIPTDPFDLFGSGVEAQFKAIGGIPSGANALNMAHASVMARLHERPTSNPTASPTILKQYFLQWNNGDPNVILPSQSLTLAPGKSYKLWGHVNWPGYSVYAELKVKWPRKVRNTYTPPTDFIGGLRIAKITLYDKYSDKSIIKKYSYPNCRSYGTGPVYLEPLSRWYKRPGTDPQDCIYDQTQGLFASSNSVHNFNAGVQAAYDTVRESIGENAEGGYNLYVYTSFMEAASVGEFPASWRLGRLRSKHSYNNNNVEVARTVYKNRIVLDPAQNFAGHTATQISAFPCFNSTLIGNPDYAPLYRQRTYSFPCDWLYVDTVWNQDFVTGIQTTNISAYDNPQHRQMTRSTTMNSDGSRYTTFIKYPTDFTLSGSPAGDADAIRQLQEKHMHSIPIEQYTQQWLPGSSSPLTISATYNRFGNPIAPQPGVVATTRNYKLELTQGISDFQPAAISGNNITRDSRYVEKAQVAEYDTRANLVSLATPGNQGMSYIWGYNNAFPIAAIQNNNNSRRAGFTSFEEEASGNWSYSEGAVVTSASQSLTGRRYLDLTLGNAEFYFRPADNSDPSPHPAPPPATYIVSYWSKNGTATIQGNGPNSTGTTGNGWTYCEHLVANPNGTITLSGNAWIDELRIYPIGCSMESFTYDPLNGITSKDDGTGRIIRYEYDIMGRLSKEKDINGNTIKGYQYQYQGTL